MPKRRAPWFTAALAVLCALLAAEVLLLVRQNRGLKAALASAATSSARAPARSRLEVGYRFTPFSLRRTDGTVAQVEFGEDAPGTLLFVFAEDCPACPLVFSTWEELAPHFGAERYRVLAVRLDPDAPVAAPVHGFPVHRLVDASQVPLEKLATVPITALLEGSGRVAWVVYGTLSDEQAGELVRFLDR